MFGLHGHQIFVKRFYSRPVLKNIFKQNIFRSLRGESRLIFLATELYFVENLLICIFVS